MTLRFKTKEAAGEFATTNGATACARRRPQALRLLTGVGAKKYTVNGRTGWSYDAEEPERRAVSIKRTYADNFRYVPGKLRMVKTK